jgi:RsiW-degrading membrane proteinase PrsW (M82 family)/ribosomal protein S27AE
VEFLVSTVLSLSFGLFWLWWYYRQDIFDKEPKRFVLLIFVLSMPLSVLAGLLEYTIDQGSGTYSEHSGFLVAAFFYVGVVAVIEELAKFFVVFTVAYPNKAFNEPMDGIVYAAASAVGFASFENVFYVLNKGPLVLLLRGPFSTLGHVLFSALWGAALGLSLNEPSRSKRFRMIVGGLVLSILAHGAYNILISLSQPFFGTGWEWLSLSGILFLFGLYIVVAMKISHALRISEFNPANLTVPARQALLSMLERRLRPQVPVRVIAPPERELPVQRYVPNPHAYRFRERIAPSTQAETNLKTTETETAETAKQTRECPNCGAANLLDETTKNCYNCGQELAQTEPRKE